MYEFFSKLLSSDFMPHGHCYRWRPEIVWLHLGSDTVIAVSYFLIPFGLIYFVHKRKDLAFNWMFILFSMFIFACGATHAMAIWTLWHGTYRLEGMVKLLTAMASFPTAILLYRLIPLALALPSPAELRRLNLALEAEVEERKRVETILAERASELERSNLELQHFASIASHDLQEPLRKIQSFSDLLFTEHSEALPEPASDYLRRIVDSAGRMRTLINDLLAYSRVTSQAAPFRRVDLQVVAHQAVADLEARIHESGGVVEIGRLPSVEADETQLGQMFQNLIVNSLKFRRDGIPVQVRVFEVPRDPGLPDAVTIAVEDNGIGFDEKYLDKIFGMFQRLHRRGAYEGSGIGLAICRKIVERHGGSITARSRPDEGSTFLVTLPFHQSLKGSRNDFTPNPDHDPNG
jgi:signal transduction histidine kinase